VTSESEQTEDAPAGWRDELPLPPPPPPPLPPPPPQDYIPDNAESEDAHAALSVGIHLQRIQVPPPLRTGAVAGTTTDYVDSRWQPAATEPEDESEDESEEGLNPYLYHEDAPAEEDTHRVAVWQKLLFRILS
jgi:hypothetical protein